MASSAELIVAICGLIRTSAVPISITLKNHTAEEAALIIGAVVERCHDEQIALNEVFVDPELAEELGLVEGKVLAHGGQPTIRCEPGLERQVRFHRD
jgi:hypothetical protein